MIATEIYFHAEDVHTFGARLDAAGTCSVSVLALRDLGDVAAYFADPNGNAP